MFYPLVSVITFGILMFNADLESALINYFITHWHVYILLAHTNIVCLIVD